MPTVSGNVGAVFNGGTITSDLTVTPPAGDTLDSIVVNKPAGAGAGISIRTPLAQTGGSCLQVQGDTGLANLASFTGGGAGYMYFTADNATPVFVANAAPLDAQIDASGCALWFDDTNGAAKVMFKGKSANGTVVTGSVALA